MSIAVTLSFTLSIACNTSDNSPLGTIIETRNFSLSHISKWHSLSSESLPLVRTSTPFPQATLQLLHDVQADGIFVVSNVVVVVLVVVDVVVLVVVLVVVVFVVVDVVVVDVVVILSVVVVIVVFLVD